MNEEKKMNNVKKVSKMTAKEFWDWHKEVSKNPPPLRGHVSKP